MVATKPAGVIFDFDGVVVDSLQVHIRAWQESYQQMFGVTLHDVDGLPGRSTLAIAEILSDRVGRPEKKIELAELKKEILRQNKHRVELLPGAALCFDWLRQHKVPFGIASNAPRSFIDSTLEALGIEILTKFGSDDVARPKPEPDVFLRCAKELRISVTDHPNVIVFEDSPHGIRAAVRAGMFPIGVLTQNTSHEMTSAGARVTCENLGDALKLGWLESLPG